MNKFGTIIARIRRMIVDNFFLGRLQEHKKIDKLDSFINVKNIALGTRITDTEK